MKNDSKMSERPLSHFGIGRLIVVALALLVAGCAEKPAESPPLDWIVGHWCANFSGISAEETWQPPEDGVFVGVGQTRQSGKTSVENLRIANIDGVLSYIAQPADQPSTTYKQTAGGESWVRFENPDHDFPQLIEYRREGDMLYANIAGLNSKGEEVDFDFDFSPCDP
jgi:hypothetical protein